MTASPTLELCQKARQCLTQGDAKTARQCYLQALAQAPESADIHYGLGTTCFLLHDLKGAVYHFSQTLQYEPQKVGALINLGAVHNQLNQPDEALKILRQAIKVDSKRAEIYYNMGLSYRQKGQAEMAIQAYREALHLNAKLIEAHYNLANLLQELGRLPQAQVHYKEALKVDPGFEPARLGLQQVEHQLNPSTPPPQARPKAAAKPSSDPAINMNQPLDPRFDSAALQALHRTTIVAENTCRDLARVLAEEMETAIKELSTSLLAYSNTSVTELGDRIQRFESAMNRVRGLQKAWQQSMQRIAELNEKLMNPVAAATASAD